MLTDPLICGHKKMIYDQACLHIRNNAKDIVNINFQTAECYKCNLQPLMKVFPGDFKSEIFKTPFGTVLQFHFNSSSFYKNTYFLEQHGHYGLNISNSGISELLEVSPSDNANGPIFALLWTFLISWMLWSVGCYVFTYTQLYVRLFQPRLIVNEAENDLGAISRSGASTPILPDISREVCANRRIQSLDVFRGMTIALMLFVNYGGGKYWIFEHSSWNGMTAADIIFPWFAWIMGASLILSLNSHLRNSVSKKQIFLKVCLRSLALCAIGIILNSTHNNNIVTLRFPGVLQRLAVAYFIVASMETVFITTPNRYNLSRPIKKIQDWIYGWAQWLIMLTLVALYVVGLYCINVPGCPKGYLGPGGLHMNSSFINCTGGSAGYIDRQIFTNKHLYNSTLIRNIYQNQLLFDPEGLLGTLTTAFTVFLGVHAARIILCYTSPSGRILRWLFMAVMTGFIAGDLCGWTKEGGLMPLNKNLWTVSFALATSSLAFFIKSLLFLLVDYKRWWSGAPFHQVGKNSILIYIGSILTAEAIPWNWRPIDLTTHSHILYMNVWSTFLWIVIAILLDNWSIYINI